MENRHQDALRRIAQAEKMWSKEGDEPVPFHLVHRGGGQRDIDHPRWDPSWAAPGESTIDDLQELGLLRVDPIDSNRNKARTFWLTMKGREKAGMLEAQTVDPAGDTTAPESTDSFTPTPQTPSGENSSEPDPRPTAFVSWAHEDGDWQATVAEFAFKLREHGINTDIDLLHLHDPSVNWTTYGPRAIEGSEFVLIPVNAAYKERWEGHNDPRTGAGGAREANVLKALFNDNQKDFLRKIKLVLLPGATTNDIPIELRAVGQRFEVATLDEHGLEDLLRTLAGRPAFVAPPLGKLPLLPPKSVGRVGRAIDASPAGATEAVADAISGLPDREKLVIALTYVEQLTRDDIADILDLSPNEVSRLVQNATSRLGDSLSVDLARAYDQPAPARHHSAHTALLADGPRSGQRMPIQPEQTMLALPERFDYDQGYAEVIDHYVYAADSVDDPDAVLFIFRHQEHLVVTDE